MDEMREQIKKVMARTDLDEREKAKLRQEIMSGQWNANKDNSNNGAKNDDEDKKVDDETLKCTICLDMCERPVTAPCQHNFCLACFKRWAAQNRSSCPTCRHAIPRTMIINPRVNTVLAMAIRMAKNGHKKPQTGPPKPYVRPNEDRPDQAFVTERAKKTGRANASSGRILVNIPNDHFGPILPEHDTIRGIGIQVGEHWKDRLDCRQWGAHFPHVAGIAGQSGVGAQSVVLSGGYEDDMDEGEWFLYTGSGGRDLSGNKRVNKHQSSDQKFTSSNEALRMSCVKGLPVRVVRSHKEKNSAYAPTTDTPVRYDGIYRILRAWRKAGKQGFLMCRYLFVRCDNAAAPWSSSDVGDNPEFEMPEAAMKEIKQAAGKKVYEMENKPYWGYDSDKNEWGWLKPAPVTKKAKTPGTPKERSKKSSAKKQLRKEFQCGLCRGILREPIVSPCGHIFCKGCLDAKFEGWADTVDRQAKTGRSLRTKKIQKPCPAKNCTSDLSEFLKTAQINRDMENMIAKLEEMTKQDMKENQEENEADMEQDDPGENPHEEICEDQQEQETTKDGVTSNKIDGAGVKRTLDSGDAADVNADVNEDEPEQKKARCIVR